MVRSKDLAVLLERFLPIDYELLAERSGKSQSTVERAIQRTMNHTPEYISVYVADWILVGLQRPDLFHALEVIE